MMVYGIFFLHFAATEVYGDAVQEKRTLQFCTAINPDQNTRVNERLWLLAYKEMPSHLSESGKRDKLTVIL